MSAIKVRLVYISRPLVLKINLLLRLETTALFLTLSSFAEIANAFGISKNYTYVVIGLHCLFYVFLGKKAGSKWCGIRNNSGP